MNSKGKMFLFILITGYITAISFIVPVLDSGNTLLLSGIFCGLGLLLSFVVAAVTPLFRKPEEQQPENRDIVSDEPEKAEFPASPFDERVVQILSIFQKNGRLVDFLLEDISSFDDKQIGSAVRNIHNDCRETMKEYLTIEPVLTEKEEASVTIESGFDPSAIRLTGNVIGDPPFKGTVRHHGWRASATKMPELPRNHDLSILEPAEVEIT